MKHHEYNRFYKDYTRMRGGLELSVKVTWVYHWVTISKGNNVVMSKYCSQPLYASIQDWSVASWMLPQNHLRTTSSMVMKIIETSKVKEEMYLYISFPSNWPFISTTFSMTLSRTTLLSLEQSMRSIIMVILQAKSLLNSPTILPFCSFNKYVVKMHVQCYPIS